ncbi:MAG: acyl-ACP--UDP-N-acetylglucosamine O-acyltransferase [Bacteroidota bacterium]
MNHALRNIHPSAKIGKNVKIGSFVTIEADVEIGDGTEIGPNVCILDGVRMGKNCKIFPGAIIGSIPQDLKFKGEESKLLIGDNVTIREYCTINRGTKANYETVIGNNCLIMAYCHIAHDCIIHDNAVLANSVTLAGHIEIGPKVVVGGLTAVHQFVRIGDHVFVGGGSLVRKDIPPYVKAAREPLAYAGVNSIGLRRRGFSSEQIHNIQDIYRILYVKGNNTSQALAKIEKTIGVTPERDKILDFIRGANRGIIRGFRTLSTGYSSSSSYDANGNHFE